MQVLNWDRKCRLDIFSADDTLMIRNLYVKLQSCSCEDVSVCATFHKYSSCTLKSYVYHTSHASPCVAFTTWNINVFGPSPTVLPNPDHPCANILPVDILYFAKVNMYIKNSSDVSSFVIARVSWYQPHPHRQLIGKPAEVWYNGLYEPFGIHSFLPLDSILCRCASVIKKINEETVKVIVPLLDD